ncbi:MAG: hypothetical protein ABIH03_15330 [Pseudomonadota bacterium]
MDIVQQIAQPSEALKLLRREIRAAEAELKMLAKRGEAVSAKQSATLESLKKREEAINGIIKRDKQTDTRISKAKDVGDLFKGVMTAQAIKGIIKGEIPNIQQLVSFAVMAEARMVKLATSVGGVKFGKFARRILPFVPFIGEIASFGMEQWNEKRRIEKNMQEIGQDFRAGKISKAEELYAQRILTNTWDDPKEALSVVKNVGAAIAKQPPEKIRSVLEGFRWEYYDPEFDPAGIGMMQKRNIDPNSFFGELQRRRGLAEGRIGGPLDDRQYEGVIRQLVADMSEKKDWPKAMLESLMESLIEKETAVKERSHREKFLEHYFSQRDRARARGRFIPARMEY